MTARPCLDCNKPSKNTRCPACQATKDRARNTRRTHYQGDWPTLSRAIRQQWVAHNGWTCPGWNTPPHPARDLTVDHIDPRTTTAGYRVLCRSCNSRRGNNTTND